MAKVAGSPSGCGKIELAWWQGCLDTSGSRDSSRGEPKKNIGTKPASAYLQLLSSPTAHRGLPVAVTGIDTQHEEEKRLDESGQSK
jgi:hypothetical protein